MHVKVFVKLKKTLKTLSSGQKNPKKNPQKTHWAGFFFFKPGFFPTLRGTYSTIILVQVPVPYQEMKGFVMNLAKNGMKQS
jgi:hypothetical protein